MKIVIDISDEQVLFDIKNHGLNAETKTDAVIIGALYDGVPLPKGHEYIDKNNAITSVCQWFTTAERNRQFEFTTNIVKQIVADILTQELTVIETESEVER